MHEHSVVADLMRRVESIAADHRARRVRGVTVWLGAMSHFSPDHFREHFLLASRSTIAEGALLTIDLGDDISDPLAQEVVLKSVEIEE